MVTSYTLSADYKTLYKPGPSFIFLASSLSIFTGHLTQQASGVVCCYRHIVFFLSAGKPCLTLLAPFPPAPCLTGLCRQKGGFPQSPEKSPLWSSFALTSFGTFTPLPSHNLLPCLCASRVKKLEYKNKMSLLFFSPLRTSVSNCSADTLRIQ